MKITDPNDERYGQEVPEPEQPGVGVPAWAQNLAGAVIVGCILSIIVAVTIRVLVWILY